MRWSERARRWLPVVVGIVMPVLSGALWCLAGRPGVGLLGLAVAGIAARIHRRRVGRPLFLLPTWLVGDPNERSPLVIENERWPHGQG